MLPNVRVRKNIRNSAARGELPEVRAFGSINFNYTTYYQRDACCPLKDIPTVAPVPAVILQHAPFCVALGNRFCLRGKARFFFSGKLVLAHKTLVCATARWKRDARSDGTRMRIPLEHRGMFPCTSSPSACLIGSSKGAKLIGLVRAMVGCLACTVTHTGSVYRCCVPALSESHPNAGQREQTKKQVDEKDWSKKKFKFRSNDCNASGEAAVNGHWETLRRNSLCAKPPAHGSNRDSQSLSGTPLMRVA